MKRRVSTYWRRYSDEGFEFVIDVSRTSERPKIRSAECLINCNRITRDEAANYLREMRKGKS